jgi:hypothetical protein
MQNNANVKRLALFGKWARAAEFTVTGTWWNV